MIQSIVLVLLEISLGFRYYAVSRTSSTNIVEAAKSWKDVYDGSGIAILGICIVLVLYLGICLGTDRLTLGHYGLNVAIWQTIFLVSTYLLQLPLQLKNNEWIVIFVDVFPVIMWVSIFVAGLCGFIQTIRSRSFGAQVINTGDSKMRTKKNYIYFGLAALLAVLMEGSCRVLYFFANQEIVRQNMSQVFWASTAGNVMDGVFLNVSEWLLACLAVLLVYRRMKLSTYLLGNIMYFVILFVVLPVTQCMLNRMFVNNVIFSIWLSLIAGVKVILVGLAVFGIASLMLKRRSNQLV
ncbi:hypothetical protein [Clostridium sp. D33t1_170424_F3]|uniref:hypothetical protein n=1 Tax=Clostridium sp. D33t1_170424_F3 TaxID=2787099 RepID=UPI0018A9A5C4|nr:hypothetical protein [Clostridium sp. D33t1_170424_F3]